MKRGRARDERGVALLIVALAMVGALTIAAIVIDVGYWQGSSRLDQRSADLAALAGGVGLGSGNYGKACRDIVGYLNTNTPDMPAIGAAAFCSQSGNDVTKTTCTPPNTLTQAAPTTTSGRYTITLHFPVPASEIADSTFGAGLNDGTPCQRMRLIVTSTEPSFFARVAGGASKSVTRSATVKAKPGTQKRIPALWLLDPTGCTSLAASGGSQVTVGTSTVPGFVAVDSDGSGCAGSQVTISSTGAGTSVTAVSSDPQVPPAVSLFALPTAATACVGHACDPSDVANGRLVPQPVSADERATRAPVDWKFNCKTGYPTYHGITVNDCPDAATTPPYLDNLKAAIGTSGQPSGYQKWSTLYSCNAPALPLVLHGNWWVDCNGGLNIGNGSSVTFADGNVVFDKGLSMTGGALSFNTLNLVPNLSTLCLTPVTPCIGSASAGAGLVYFRTGDLNITGGVITVNHAAMYLSSGFVKIAGGAPPVWSSPTEGPFAGLSLWSELSSNKFQINGGAGVDLRGTFFTPEANPMTLTGGGNWAQQHAQFITYHLAVSGGGVLTMAPDNVSPVPLPPTAGMLIR